MTDQSPSESPAGQPARQSPIEAADLPKDAAHRLEELEHGLFTSDNFRKAFLAQLDIPTADQPYRASVESALDALADHIETHLDVEGLLALAR